MDNARHRPSVGSSTVRPAVERVGQTARAQACAHVAAAGRNPTHLTVDAQRDAALTLINITATALTNRSSTARTRC